MVAGYAGATPLVAPLFLGPLDIAGDTHGEMEKRQSEAVLNWGRAPTPSIWANLAAYLTEHRIIDVAEWMAENRR